MKNGYGFLVDVSKNREVIESIHRRFSKGGNLLYLDYNHWITVHLSKFIK